MKRLVAGLSATLLMVPVVVRAQGDKYAPFTAQLPAAARALGMGGATAATRDAEAALGNPALAGTVTSASVSVARYGNRATAGVLANGGTIGSLGISVAVSYLDFGSTALLSSLGATQSADLARQSTLAVDPAASLSAGLATSLTWKGLRWGVAATYHEARGVFERASVVGATLGVSKDNVLLAGSSMGLMVQNAGPALRFNGARVQLPTRLAWGWALPSRSVGSYVDVTGTLGSSVRRDGDLFGSAGLEVSFTPIEGVSFAARGGMRRPELTVQDPVTVGAGFSFDRLVLDYAWEQLEHRAAHRLTVRWR